MTEARKKLTNGTQLSSIHRQHPLIPPHSDVKPALNTLSISQTVKSTVKLSNRKTTDDYSSRLGAELKNYDNLILTTSLMYCGLSDGHRQNGGANTVPREHTRYQANFHTKVLSVCKLPFPPSTSLWNLARRYGFKIPFILEN